MNGVDVRVMGEYACFTRPEFKVERVSYPVMTPAAARGFLESIYWKPQIRYKILRIGIIELGTQTSILRNEISNRQTDKLDGIFVDNERQQRTSLILQDVVYRIQAHLELINGENNIGKHLDCARRRIDKGQYHHKPYLGCREFSAEFEMANDFQDKPNSNINISIGNMLYDTAYIEDEEWYRGHKDNRIEFWKHKGKDTRLAKGYTKRLFIEAQIKEGWLTWSENKFEEIMRLEGCHGIF
jgi:CRISPR-associated protein Cas5d